MTGDVASTAEALGMDPAVLYRLRDDGPLVYPRVTGPCWWCHAPQHSVPLPGNACPVRAVPFAALSADRRLLREVLS